VRILSKTIGVIALLWAIGAPIHLLLADMRDEQVRKLRALHSIVSDNEKPLVKEITEKEMQHSGRSTCVVFGSSALLVVLAVIVLSKPWNPN
jgi:hypothetical protein